MSVDRKQVEPAIQVVVKEEETELQRRLGGGTQAVEVGQVRELQAFRLVADVQCRHLIGEVANRQAEPFVIAKAGPVAAHAPARRARLVKRDAGKDGDFLEFAMSQVMEQKILNSVVGYRDVDQTVAVHIEGGDSQRLGQGDLQIGRTDLDARFLADVGEVAGIVPQQSAERSRKRCRRPVSPPQAADLKPLDLVDLGSPGDVIAEEQVKIAIVIDVNERRPGEPAVRAPGVGGCSVTSSKWPLPSLRNRCPPPMAVM